MSNYTFNEMTAEEKSHFENNKSRINMWIDTNAILQPTSEVLLPLIAAYERETEYRVRACSSCLIDCLIWCRIIAHGNPYILKDEPVIKKKKRGEIKK